MLYFNGQVVTPVSYLWGSGQVTVKYESGKTVTVPVHEITSPNGEAFVANQIRLVRIKE